MESPKRIGRLRLSTSKNSSGATGLIPTAARSATGATRRKIGGAAFHITEVKEREFKLDSFKWLNDESLEEADELPEPEELATDAIAELESAVAELNTVMKLLEGENGETAAARR
jgi:hypothetical protein